MTKFDRAAAVEQPVAQHRHRVGDRTATQIAVQRIGEGRGITAGRTIEAISTFACSVDLPSACGRSIKDQRTTPTATFRLHLKGLRDVPIARPQPVFEAVRLRIRPDRHASSAEGCLADAQVSVFGPTGGHDAPG